MSRFSFTYADDADKTPRQYDEDGDVIVKRKRSDAIEIEHQKSTDLTLVGLQVWRGALILADFIFHNRHKFVSRNILEMGSGVGLTSIVAAIHSERNVCCTDIDTGGILQLISKNVLRNKRLMSKCQVNVMPLDFSDRNWTTELQTCVRQADIILAADGRYSLVNLCSLEKHHNAHFDCIAFLEILVIYDDDITDAFVKTLAQILDPDNYNTQRNKEIYIALEKRYVFTLAELETSAPCYEYFLHVIEPIRRRNGWKLETISIDFPQYFEYERARDLVLMKLYL